MRKGSNSGDPSRCTHHQLPSLPFLSKSDAAALVADRLRHGTPTPAAVVDRDSPTHQIVGRYKIKKMDLKTSFETLNYKFIWHRLVNFSPPDCFSLIAALGLLFSPPTVWYEAKWLFLSSSSCAHSARGYNHSTTDKISPGISQANLALFKQKDFAVRKK